MNNTVLVESKLRQKLKLACALMCVFCLFFIAFVVVAVMIEKQNLNGQTDEVTGTLSEIFIDDTNTVTLDGDKHYNVVWDVKESNANLNDYLNKTVTLIVTRDTFAASNPWALGFDADGQTIIDYRATLETKLKENKELKTALIVVTAVMCVATCGLFIWRFNVQPVVEHVLYEEFGEFLSQRQPSCKQRKYWAIYILIYFAILLALLITSVTIDPDAETISELIPAAKTVLWTLLAVTILGGVGLFVFKEWIVHKEIEFYADKLPFDFSDISHAPLRKKVKEKLQQEILKDYAEHPDTYADGGNGYDVVFGENGITLCVPLDDWEPDAQTRNNAEMPDADAVFANTVADENITATTQSNAALNRAVKTFSYGELNFEAVAHFRKNIRPMMIIIKSRLTRTDDFPEEFVNDIHIAFDLNLFNTLKKYDVEVENLQYLLENKKQLMLENCLFFSKNKGKTTK